ncbi:MAG: hypothetical protein M1817_003816 [Caeruleum heppii]|nr:MAG: hypothetical protein M1817_003816 [Caeruleum heppii]
MEGFDHDHPGYKKLQEIGKEITTQVKPSAVVVFSAHWQGESNQILVNTAEKTDIIYDFHGFPPRYYQVKYPNVGSTPVAEKVIGLLREAGVGVRAVERGLDHGVWSSFRCAFDPDDNPLGVPIVQASLFDTEDPDQHYRLGQAVSALRSQNILVVVSGMAVHNLYDLGVIFSDPRPLPYVVTFDEALKDAVEAPVTERQAKLASLLKRSDARKAHPTFEHLLPVYVGAGAAGADEGKRMWTFQEASISWAQFRWGEVA